MQFVLRLAVAATAAAGGAVAFASAGGNGAADDAAASELEVEREAPARDAADEENAAALAEFIAMAEDVGIVILGEVHGNPYHHANQARIVAALQPEALVFEMIPQQHESVVNELRAAGADRDAIAEALEWEERGWPDFDFYAEILEAAPEARVFGGGQPHSDVRRAMVEGAAGPFGPDAAIYGLDQPLDPEEQALREAIMLEAHCNSVPPEVLPGMVEAQRFRDAGLADAAQWARTMTGGQVVVITGNAHADLERGMPEALRHADPEVSLIALGQLEAAPDPDREPPFDFVIVTEAPDRPDPCAIFFEKEVEPHPE